MQFKKSSVVGVLIVLCLSTDSWCHYVPEKKIVESNKKNDTSLSKEKIQICGNALTTLIIEACDGFVGSPNQGNHVKNSVQSKITEDCCDKECPLDYLQNYCGHTPLFTTKLSTPKVLEPNTYINAKYYAGFSIYYDNLQKTVRGKLLNSLNSRNRGGKQENDIHTEEKDNKNSDIEQRNVISRQWPSLQIGTISPEMDRFGGQPIVVIKKNTINFN